MRLLDALHQDVRYALRGLRARPAFTLVVVVSIALGIGANATMFGILDRLLFRAPDGISDPDHVMQVQTLHAGSPYTDDSFSYPAYVAMRDGVPAFSGVAATSSGTFPLGRGPGATSVAGAIVSPNFFTVLGVRPALGRFFSDDDGDVVTPHAVAVLSYGFWKRHFGAARSAIGQSLDIGTTSYTVIGVTSSGFVGIDLNYVDVWLPIAAAGGVRFDNSPRWSTNRGSQYLSVLGRVRDGIDIRVAAEQATAAYRADERQRVADDPQLAQYVHPDSDRAVLASLIPGRAPQSWGSPVSADGIRVAELLSLVALLVLAIACANVINLLLGRALERRREIALRLALGVSRARLVAQLFIEGLILAALGGGGALVVVYWTSAGLRTLLIGSDAWTADPVDVRMLGFIAATCIVTAFVTSLVPALQASRTNAGAALKLGARDGGGQTGTLRRMLVVVQAALGVALLAGAGLFVRSVRNIESRPYGIDFDHVLVGQIAHASVGLSTAEALRLYREFEERVRQVPGVRYTAVSIGLPFRLNWTVRLFAAGRALPEVSQSPAQYGVTPDYFKAMGIPLVAGRGFTSSDRVGASAVAIVNQTMARLYWPGRDPVGECLKVGADTMPCTTVVGVVGNTARQQLREGLIPQFYRPLDQLPLSAVDQVVSHFGYDLVVHTGGSAATYAEPVRRAMQAVSAIVPYASVTPMRDLLDRRTRAWRLGASVFSAFGILALVLIAVGLYGVLAFALAQRRHEFGVRVALGAQASDVLRVSMRTGLAPAIAGMAAGVLIALAAAPFVRPLLFDVSPRDPTVLGAVCGIVLGTCALASVIPARRASRVDPMQVLRAD